MPASACKLPRPEKGGPALAVALAAVLLRRRDA